MSVTITFDLEDNRPSPDYEERFVMMSDRFLSFVDERDITATVFIVGELGRSHPDIVRRVAKAGHEIGLHGLRHVALDDVGPKQLRTELLEGRALLEDVAQTAVSGFRAPFFSLTHQTAWAVEDIKAAGFSYSSSILPATSPLYGLSGAPRVPFRWANGLIEFPCPVAGVGHALIPFLGGVYLRYLPMPIVRRFLSNLDNSVVAWSYCHPFDLDPDEPFFMTPYAGWLTSRILHGRRRATLSRIEELLTLGGGAGRTLAEIAGELANSDLPVVEGSGPNHVQKETA